MCSDGVTTNQVDEELTSELKTIFSSRLSCKDLDSSLFLGPNEIRACCKRFFVNGEQKGDVVLLEANPEITLSDINEAREDLIARINREEAPECEGCPYIERQKKPEIKINYISLENFAYCNMCCTIALQNTEVMNYLQTSDIEELI